MSQLTSAFPFLPSSTKKSCLPFVPLPLPPASSRQSADSLSFSARLRTYSTSCNQTQLLLQAIADTKVNMTVWLGAVRPPLFPSTPTCR